MADAVAESAGRTYSRVFQSDRRRTRAERIDELLDRAPDEPKSPAQSEADRRFVVAGGSLGCALVGAAGVPALTLVGGAGVIYAIADYAGKAVVDWRTERKIGFPVLMIFFGGGMLATGKIALANGFRMVYAIVDRASVSIYDDSRATLVDALGDMPRHAYIERGDGLTRVPLDAIAAGDIMQLGAGEMVCADGFVVDGHAELDEAALTGESQPVGKAVGDRVLAGTLVLAGDARVRVEHAGSATTAHRIGRILGETADHRGATVLMCERITDRSVVPRLAMFGLTLGVLGTTSAVAVITCSIGSQMRVTGPISMLTFLRLATDRGILIKDGRAFESAHEVDVVVLDKTGTLTTGRPQVVTVHVLDARSPGEVLGIAAAVEARQGHPIAEAIRQAARGLTARRAEGVKVTPGFGISARVDGHVVEIGSGRFMEQRRIVTPDAHARIVSAIRERGGGLVHVAIDGERVGVIELADELRPEAPDVVRALQARGKQVHILSGDHEAPTRTLAEALGVDGYFAGVLPDEKGQVVDRFQAEGRRVAFVGDGINDAIALKKAGLSVSMRGSTSLALDTAQVLLYHPDLTGLVELFDLAERYRRNTQALVAACTVPGLFNIGTVYLLGTGIVFASGLTFLGLGVGLASALAPLNDVRTPRIEALDRTPGYAHA